MARRLNSGAAYQLNDAKKILSQQVTHILNGPALPKNRIVRLELSIAPIDILNWLSTQNATSKIYWSDREGTFEAGGIGLAYALHGTRTIDYDAIFSELEQYLMPENRNLKFFGGIAFNSKSFDKDWEPFGTYRFVLPRFEILRRGDETYFACNFFADESRKAQINILLTELEALPVEIISSRFKLIAPISRHDDPTKEKWNKGVHKIIESLGTSHLQKVVLARKSSFQFSETLPPIDLVRHLKGISPECFHFCFNFDEATAFIGASPERLYKRESRLIQSEALAGTRPRGQSQNEDNLLKKELLNSEKERREHMFVVNMIKESLKAFCASVELETKTNLLPLSGGQHLLTCLEGLLSNATDDAVILKQLHPTPAVGGFPTPNALKAIENFEPFKRGWYAGPVGYVGFDNAEFAVAIRSGLIKKNKLFLFAGAGIVPGSSPEAEWNEIETKISNFIEIFQNGSSKIP